MAQSCWGMTRGAIGLSYWGSLGCCVSTLWPPEISQVLFPSISCGTSQLRVMTWRQVPTQGRAL